LAERFSPGTKGRSDEAHRAIAADLGGWRSTAGGVQRLRCEFPDFDHHSSEELVDDSSAGEGDHNYCSTGHCLSCQVERDHSSIDHGAPCHDAACSDSSGKWDHRYCSAGNIPTGQCSAGDSPAGYIAPSYRPTDHDPADHGPTDDDNEPRGRRGWSRVLVVLASEMGQRADISSPVIDPSVQ
jgi:hypothetical protein